MPRLSKKTMFAIEAVLDVAFHVGDHPVRSGDITERQRIPKRYLEQVLQHLVRAGILNGKRGPRGGYRLGRDRVNITLGEVVRVVRNLEVETEPSDPSIGSPLAHEVVWPLWEKLRKVATQVYRAADVSATPAEYEKQHAEQTVEQQAEIEEGPRRRQAVRDEDPEGEPRQQQLDDVRTDEPCATGDKNVAHAIAPVLTNVCWLRRA